MAALMLLQDVVGWVGRRWQCSLRSLVGRRRDAPSRCFARVSHLTVLFLCCAYDVSARPRAPAGCCQTLTLLTLQQARKHTLVRLRSRSTALGRRSLHQTRPAAPARLRRRQPRPTQRSSCSRLRRLRPAPRSFGALTQLSAGQRARAARAAADAPQKCFDISASSYP